MTVPPFFSKKYLKGLSLLDRIGFSTIKWSACDRSSIFNKNLLYHTIYKVKKYKAFLCFVIFSHIKRSCCEVPAFSQKESLVKNIIYNVLVKHRFCVSTCDRLLHEGNS